MPKDAPMLAELYLFAVVVTLVFSPAARRTFPLAARETSLLSAAERSNVIQRLYAFDKSISTCPLFRAVFEDLLLSVSIKVEQPFFRFPFHSLF